MARQVSFFLMWLLLACAGETHGPAKPPWFEAGPDRTVVVGSQAILDVTASQEVADGSLSFEWKLLVQPPGGSITLINPFARSVEFTPDLAGVYLVQLTVRDGGRHAATDLVQVIAVAEENATQPESPPGEIIGQGPGSPCVPQCTGRSCGDDGCGGSCGSCGAGSCQDGGQCVYPCSRCSNNYGCQKALFASAQPDCTGIPPDIQVRYETVCECGCKLGAGGGNDDACQSKCGLDCQTPVLPPDRDPQNP